MVRALSLSGGGAKTAYQAGALQHLMHDLRRDYSILTGISGGALNVGRLAQFPYGHGKTAALQLVEDWSTLKQSEVYKSWFPFGKLQVLCNPSIYNSRPLHKYVRERVKLDLVRQSGRHVIVGAVCLETGAYRLFTEKDDCFVEGLIGSAGYPLAFLPVTIEGLSYSDGGLRNGTPIGAAIRAGATAIDIILTAPEKETFASDLGADFVSTTLRGMEIMSDEIFQTDIAQAVYVNRLIQYGEELDKRPVEINVLRPSSTLTDDSLDFSQQNIQRILRRGWDDARSGKMVRVWPTR